MYISYLRVRFSIMREFCILLLEKRHVFFVLFRLVARIFFKGWFTGAIPSHSYSSPSRSSSLPEEGSTWSKRSSAQHSAPLSVSMLLLHFRFNGAMNFLKFPFIIFINSLLPSAPRNFLRKGCMDL